VKPEVSTVPSLQFSSIVAMESSDSDIEMIVKVRNDSRKPKGGGNKAASKRRRKPKPTGPPPRLAWGAAGVSGGVGGGTGVSATTTSSSGLGGIGSETVRSSIGSAGSGVSGASAGTGRRKGIADSEDDDGLWADDDDDDDVVVPPASSSRAAGGAAAAAAGSNRKTKKGKKLAGVKSSTSRQSLSSSPESSYGSLMWVDKYAPTNAADLCVAPKKVKEIREWMVQTHSPPQSDQSWSRSAAMDGGYQQQQQQQQQREPIVPRLLVLVGSPGVGKSSTVHVLASELGWTVHQWNDAQQDTAAGGGYSHDAALSVRWQSQLSSFGEFLGSAGSGFSPLALDGGGSAAAAAGGGGGGGLSSTVSSGRKRKSSASVALSTSTSDRSKGSIILIEDIPNLYNPEAEMTFRNIMSQHLYRSKIPTVLIFSDVCEGKHRPNDLERLVDPSVLYSPSARICQIHGVAKPKMKKCLQTIVKAERLKVSDTLFEELHSSSKGDMRHAIMALQFQFASAGGTGKAMHVGGSRGQSSDRARDTKLSTFHALGKLLYAKRKKLGSEGDSAVTARATWNSILPSHLYDNRPSLEFVPEDVMNKSDIERSGAVSFLSYHSPEYFTDETELSTAFDHFSDAALFLDRTYSASRDRSDSIFPLEYVSSIAGRAVANANKNPAPNRFRQLNAPKIFEVTKKKKGNEVSMLQLCKRLSCGSDILSLGTIVGSTNHFVVDTLPYLRNIVPGDVDSALANLYSYARPMDLGGASSHEDAGRILRRHIKEQNEVLAEDDIADDDDSVDENPTSGTLGRSGGSVENHTDMSTNMDRKMPALHVLPKSVNFSASSVPKVQAREVIILD